MTIATRYELTAAGAWRVKEMRTAGKLMPHRVNVIGGWLPSLTVWPNAHHRLSQHITKVIMRLSTSVGFVALSCTLLASCSTVPHSDAERFVARTPEQVIDVFVAAVNSGNMEQVLAVYEPDARLAFPGRPYVGHDEIRIDLENLLSQKPRMKGRTLGVSQVGELALLRSEWSYVGTDARGGRIERSGKSTEVVRRQRDGTWLYVIDLPMGTE